MAEGQEHILTLSGRRISAPRSQQAELFGDRHPVAPELGELLVSLKPLQYEDNPRIEAILFGPEHTTLPLIQRGLAAAEALHEHATGSRTPAV